MSKCRCGILLTAQRPYCVKCFAGMRGAKENVTLKKQREAMERKAREANQRPLPEVDMRIVVMTTDNGSSRLIGTVKYVGKTVFAAGDWIGVELDRPLGKNSGSVLGANYFVCAPNHGLFVQPVSVVAQGDEVKKWLQDNKVTEEYDVGEEGGIAELLRLEDMSPLSRAISKSPGLGGIGDQPVSNEAVEAIKATLGDKSVDKMGLTELRKELTTAREGIRQLLMINKQLQIINDRLESGHDLEAPELASQVKRQSVLKMRKDKKEAATKIQSMARGKKQRKKYQKVVEERQKAATKLQALHRGEKGRKEARSKRYGIQVQVSAQRKERLAEVFKIYDTKKAGVLKSRELFPYAQKIGYPGLQNEFIVDEYESLCVEYRVDKSQGFNLAKWLELVDIEAGDYYCSESLLTSLLLEFQDSRSKGDSAHTESQSRFEAVSALFTAFDLNNDGLLNLMEAFTFAKTLGLATTPQEFDKDYRQLCQDADRDPATGFGLHLFRQMLDREGDVYYCDNARLDSILQEKMGGCLALSRDVDEAKALITRRMLMSTLFATIDGNKNDILTSVELHRLAKILGYPSGKPQDEQDFEPQFRELCFGVQCSPNLGMNFENFKTLIDNENGVYYLENGKIVALTAQLEGEDSTKKANASASASKKREEKISVLFKALDTNDNAKLTIKEIFNFAQLVGFPGSEKEFGPEYKDLCKRLKCDESKGLDLKLFTQEINDKQSDYHCDMGMLDEFISKLPPPATREDRIKRLFKICDVNKNERLTEAELFPFAQEVGFPGTLADFKDEYKDLCKEVKADPGKGLDEAAFLSVVNNKKSDWYNDDQMLSDNVKALEKKLPPATAKETPAPVADQAGKGVSRTDRVEELFNTVDKNRNGRLSCAEVFKFAQLLGFPGTEAEFKPDFDDLSKEAGGNGINLAAFTKMVNNQNHDCYCDEGTLTEVLQKLGPASPAPAAPATTSETSNAAANSASAMPAATASTPAASPAAAPTREDNIQALFQALDVNKNGRLTCPELYKFACLVGYEDAEEDFLRDEYPDRCKECGVDTQTGLNVEQFSKIVNDEEGDYASDDEALVSFLKQLGVVLPGAAPQASTEAVAAEPVAPESRDAQIAQLFGLCDKDQDGRLNRTELYAFAQLVGYPESEEDFQEEYQSACADQQCKTDDGLDANAFAKLVNDPDGDFNCDDGQLAEFLSQLGGSTAAGAGASASAVAAPEAPQSREDMVAAAFKVLDEDGDGRLNLKEMFALAQQVGFPDGEAEFKEEYDNLCQECKCEATAGLDFNAFNRQVNDNESDYFLEEAQLREILNGGDTGDGGAEGAGDQSREDLIKALFDALDPEKQGFVTKSLMFKFAQYVEYPGTAEEFYAEEWVSICEKSGSNQEQGLKQDDFAALINDEESDWNLEDEQVAEFLNQLNGDGGGDDEDDGSDKLRPLFEACDLDKNGKLDSKELFRFAQALGYPEDEEVFKTTAYTELCEQFEAEPAAGLDFDMFVQFTTDEESDFYVADDEYDGYLEQLRK